MSRDLLGPNAVFLVTGAAGGIGAQTVRTLIEAGHRVAACDLQEQAVRELCEGLGERAVPMVLDVRDEAAWASVVDTVWETLGGIDVLVNNAGICNTGRLDEMASGAIDIMMDVNVGGVMRGMRAVLPRMRERGSGHIVNISSLAGIAPLPGLAAYAASKHAVRAVTHSCSFELAGSGVTLTAVCPGPVETQMLAGQLSDDNAAVSFSDKPLQPQDIAQAVLRAATERPYEIVIPALRGGMLRVVGGLPGVVGRLLVGVQRRGRAEISRRRAGA